MTPSLAGIEPVVVWLQSRGLARASAAVASAAAVWLAGLGSLFSLNLLASWRPFAWIPVLATKTVFEAADFIAGNVLLPVGALLTCVFIGWRLDRATFDAELEGTPALVVAVCRVLLRYLCPLAIATVLFAALFQSR